MVVGEFSKEVESVVVGGGPAGYLAAIRLSQLGKDVALVEKRRDLGGVCLNEGCIPSKSLIHAAGVYHDSVSSSEMGVGADEEDVSLDFERLQDWKDGVVDRLTSGVESLEDANGVDVLRGEAVFDSETELRVVGDEGTDIIEFESCVIATGSEPIEVPSLPTSHEGVVDAKGALELEEVPDRLAVVGGGYIGTELGTAYAKLGSEVTVIESLDRILSNVPEDVVEPVRHRADEIGVEIKTDARAEGIETNEDGSVTLSVSVADDECEIEADVVLVAVGRQPTTAGLRLEKAGVETDDDGYIHVDDQMRTSNPSVFAAGDVAGEPLLAHKAYHEAKVAAEVISGEASAAEFVVPSVIYTDPEIATVGMTREDAEDRGYDVGVGRFPFSASGRALTKARDDGFVKVVVDAETEAILGAQMVGDGVSELISEATLAVEMGALVSDVSMTVHPHPTVSEAFREACEDAVGEAIHKP
ncbi:dihydrolipoyl dehydrogenase [Halorutilales archaeon Cl-col2-1]